MKEILEWDAVLADGTRIPIALTIGSAAGFFLCKVDGRGGTVCEKTPALAAHEACGVLMGLGHDVRDLVPRGNPSRAELEATIRGSEQPPIDAEIEALEAVGGTWRTYVPGEWIFSGDLMDADETRKVRDVQLANGAIVKGRSHWWALDADGAPCARPKP